MKKLTFLLIVISFVSLVQAQQNVSKDTVPGGFIKRTVLFNPGDYNSMNYRIPGIITAKDGSLVSVTDKRKFNEGDLPQDIDIVCRRSVDGGYTWTAPYTIAQGTGVNHGYGDCALVWGNEENELIAVFVGGVGLWNSTATNPQRSYLSRSLDNGATWSTPIDITDFIFGSNCVVPAHRSWRSSFFGSGNGLRTSTGRLIFVAAIRETSAHSLNNYAVYSDDNGETWQVSERASVAGDESKVVELADGRILMSIRHAGNRWYNISGDGGETWQSTTSTWYDLVVPACNGDIIRYTSENQEGDKNRILHSLPVGTERENVTVFMSYDEGQTWPVSRCVVPYASAYSSLCILPDRTIGLYVEEMQEGASGYSTVFYNFSLDWLSHGTDSLPSLSVELPDSGPQCFSVYPIPSLHQLKVDMPDLVSVSLYTLSGQLAQKYDNIDSPPYVIDVSSFASGVYIIKAVNRQGAVKMSKFVVESER